jgi:hypothetical protein
MAVIEAQTMKGTVIRDAHFVLFNIRSRAFVNGPSNATTVKSMVPRIARWRPLAVFGLSRLQGQAAGAQRCAKSERTGPTKWLRLPAIGRQRLLQD